MRLCGPGPCYLLHVRSKSPRGCPQARQAQVETLVQTNLSPAQAHAVRSRGAVKNRILSWGAATALPVSSSSIWRGIGWVRDCQPWRKRRFLWMLHRRLLKFAWSCLSHQFAGSGWTSLRGHLHQTCPSPYPLAQAATSSQALLYPYYNQPFLSGLEPFWFQGPRHSVNLQNFNMTYLYIPNPFMIWNMQHVFENKKISRSWPKS